MPLIRLPSFPFLPAILLFLAVLSELLLISPRIRLLESLICRSHYRSHEPARLNPDGSVPESLCKISAVQERLAYIRGTEVFFEALPVLLFAIPWGRLADRVGRKPVLAINFFGCALHILYFLVICHPKSTARPELIWASGATHLLAGGPRTAGVLILALVTDASTEKSRSERFYFTYSAFLITELVAPPLAAGLMKQYGILSPFWVALGSLGAALMVLMRVLPPAKAKAEGTTSSLLLPSADGATQPKGSGITRPIALALFLHFLCPVRQELLFQILIPYASVTFSLPISSSGLLLSIVAISNLIAITVFLPLLQHRLRSARNYRPIQVDAFTARLSCCLLIAGCAALATSAKYWAFCLATVVFAGGFGVRLAALSLLTGFVGGEKVAGWYGGVAVVEGLGEIVSAQVLQGVWAWSLERGKEHGGWGWGVVWWVGAVAYALGWWVVGRIKQAERR